MTRFAFLVLALLPLLVQAQSDLVWSAPIEVADVSFDNLRPRIDVLADGSPIVLWGDVSPKTNLVARWNGNGFDAPVEVQSSVTPFVTGWAGSDLATHGNSVFVVLKDDAANGRVYLCRSTDGGSSWSDTIRVEDLAPMIARFPTVDVTADGNPQVGFMEFESGWFEPQLAVARSLDGGLTFEAPVAASDSAPGEACDCCQPTMVASGTQASLLFRNNDNNIRDIWLAHSSDGGATFPDQLDIDGGNWMEFTCQSTSADGYHRANELVSVWMSAGHGSPLIYYGIVDLNTMSLVASETVNDDIPAGADQNHPRIAGSGDTLGIVYEERFLGSTNIMMQYSVSGISGLSTADTVNVQMIGTQENADIAYANGTFHVVFQDNATGLLMYRSATSPTLTSVADASQLEPRLIAWPIPASETVSFELPDAGTGQLVIQNVQGAAMLQQRAAGSRLQIDVTDWPAGVYFATWTGRHGTATARVLVR